MVDVATQIDTAPAPHRVSGTVRYSDDTPAADCSVEAFDRDLVGEPIKLGEGQSDAVGAYDIPYSLAALSERGKAAADLVVKVFDAEGELLVTSALIPSADAATVVHLQIERAAIVQSEYDRLLAAIGPRLRGTPLADLTADSVTYLAAVTGQESKHIERLADSARCVRDLSPDGGELPESVVYAWLSQGLPATASELVMQPRTRLKQALERAQAANIVTAPSARLRAANANLARRSTPLRTTSVDDTAWTEAVANLVWQRRVERELTATAKGQALSAADLFRAQTQSDGAVATAATPLLSADKLRVVAELLSDAEGARKVDPESLAANGFDRDETALTLRLLALAELTKDHLPLVHELHALELIDVNRPPGSLSYLAQLRTKDWRGLVQRFGTPTVRRDMAGDGDAQAAYAADLERRLELSCRTAVIAARIKQNLLVWPGAGRSDLISFFDSNPDFEFGKHYVHAALHKRDQAGLVGIGDKLALRRDLLKLERTIKLTNGYRQQSVLLARGFTSALGIARYGRRDFVRQVGRHPAVGDEEAKAILDKAEQIASVAMNLALRYRNSGAEIPVIASSRLGDRAGAVRNTDAMAVTIPDLITLFGSLDGTACDPCLTVLSPAAYFVDLLQFLKNRKTPSVHIHRPSETDEIPLLADEDSAQVEVQGVYETGGIKDLIIAIAPPFPATSQAADSSGVFLKKIPVSPVKPYIVAYLSDGDAVIASDTRDVKLVRQQPKGDLKDVNPAKDTVIYIGNADTEYTLSVSGDYAVLGVARFAIQVISNTDKAVDVDLQSGSFRATIVNSADSDAKFTVSLTTHIGGVKTTLSTVTNKLVINRIPATPVTGTIVITKPDTNPECPKDDVQFQTGGTFTFDGTDDLAHLSVYVVSVIERTVDSRETEVLRANTTFGSNNGKGAFKCPIDFGIVRFVGSYAAKVTATLVFEPPGQPVQRLRETVVSFSIDVYLPQDSSSPDINAGAADEEPLAKLLPLASEASATALDVLLKRRPDLVDIELSCENSQTLLPYADLVLEILECAAVGDFPLEIKIEPAEVPNVVTELNAQHIPTRLQAALELAVGVSPTDGDRVRVLKADSQWRLTGRGYRIAISQVETAALRLDWFVPQTADQAEQIAGEPEHAIAAAYEKLSLAGFPWALPFDLPSEASRTYLSHLGASRAQLIETFDRSTSFQVPELAPLTGANFRSAAERRGFTTADLRIISGEQKGTGTTADPDYGPWNFWGFKAAELSPSNSIPDPRDSSKRIENGHWVDVLMGRLETNGELTGGVAVFLQQSGLAYDELRELLEMRFVNTSDDDGSRAATSLGLAPFNPQGHDPANSAWSEWSDMSPGGRIEDEEWVLRVQLGTVHLEDDARQVRSSDLNKARLVTTKRQADVLAVLDRMHRFVRLWRKIGWPMRHLDQALALAPRPGNARWPVLDGSVVGSLDRFEQVGREQFGRPVHELSLFATHRYRDYSAVGEPLADCLYERLFINKSIANPPDPAFALHPDRTELLHPNEPARHHLSHIAASCGFSLQDAFLLLGWHGQDPKLSLVLLSSMFWSGLIARTKRIEVRDLLDLFSLQMGNGMAPIWKDPQADVVTSQPVELGLRFVSTAPGQVNVIRFWKPRGETGVHVGRLWNAAGKQLREVRFRHESASGWQEQRLPHPVRIEAGTLYVVSVNANASYAFTENGMVGTQMGYLMPVGDGQNGVTGEAGSFPTVSQNSPNYYRDIGFAVHSVARSRALFVENLHAADFTLPEALRLLSHRQTVAEAAEEEKSIGRLLGEIRQELVAIAEAASSPAEAGQVDQQMTAVVRNRLQASLGMESGTIGRLLGEWLVSSGDPSLGFAIADFLYADFVQSDPAIPVTSEGFPRPFRTCVRLGKVAALVTKFKLTDVSLSWLFGPSAGPLGWLNPNRLPAASDESPESFRPLLRATNLFRLRDAMPDGEASLARIFAAAADGSTSREQVLEQVHLATAWNAEDLAALLGTFGFNLQAVDALKAALQSEHFLHRLVDCFAVMRRIGASALQCLDWSQSEIDHDAAADTRRLARSRHTEDGWVAVSKPLRDTLREKQRAALVAYLMGRDQLRDGIDMYDRYLIDVEMRPTAQTSRIKQACASVQTFVQRCLLNLEPDVPPEAIDPEQWAWMKNYRVWEANRKVFLFPENWIEPELRDDKSEVFRQLESDLLQSDVTHEVGIEAFKSYAERLGDIARLTVVAMCDESDDEGVRIVHLLGRDGSSPHRHYYRQWRIPPKSDGGYWTPWEEVATGIDSEHVLIFKFAGAVCIAWPTVKGLDERGAKSISLSLVHRRETGWTAPKRSRGTLSWTPPPNIDETRGLVFKVDATYRSGLRIVCNAATDPTTSIIPRPFVLKAMDGSGPDDEQLATLHVRNLVRYRDAFGVAHHWVATNLPVEVFVKLKPAYSTTASHTNKGEIRFTAEAVLKEFNIPPLDPRTGEERRLENLSFGLKRGDSHDNYEALGIREEFDVSKMKSFWLTGDTVFNIIRLEDMEQEDKDRIALDRTLSQWTTIGAFVQTDLALVSISENTKTELPSAYENSDYYLSIYREMPDKNTSFSYMPSENLQYELQKEDGDRFVATAPLLSDDHPAFVTAYTDSRYDLIFRRRSGTGFFSVVPASCEWGTQLRGALNAGQAIAAMEIQQTFVPVTIKNGAAVDESSSYFTLGIDFEADLPWAGYNWETFFHVPILVATQLTRNQRFEEAQRWFHLVFDPMSDRKGDGPARYWRFRPFQDLSSEASIEEELIDLAAGRTKLQDQIAAWREKPFLPHAIARSRPRAYQIFVVMKYLDNLIAWADRLFLNDTIESINEATQLYLLASRILGRRSRRVAFGSVEDVRTYSELSKIDDFSNVLVQLETLVPAGNAINGNGRLLEAPTGVNEHWGLYFGVPANQDLSSYWDTVEDRLFKVRNSLNLEGIARQLPLYEPPIDPAILVRATAAGVDIASVISDLQGPMPFHRFNLLSQKALELANEVKALGSSLLSAIEKQDGEMLALTRSTHEVAMLKLISTVRQSQSEEAKLNAASLRKTRELIATRYAQYQRLLGKSSLTIPAEGVNAGLESTPERAVPALQAAGGDTGGLALTTSENEHLEWLNVANNYTIASGFLQTAAGTAHLFPDLSVGVFGIATTYGGSNIGSSLGALGSAAGVGASNASYQGGRSATVGGHKRRMDEWAFQSNLAAKELEQVDKQIAAADLRAAISELEQKNHRKQMENAEEIDVLMRDKFSNQQLFRWMSGQAASLHFRAYQLARAAARRAEKAYRFELGLGDKDSNFIQFGYWDSLKKGLMAGESLALDIRRMEAAYLEKNERELEITKHVSLRQLDGAALLNLRATGECSFKLPETLFDLDFPGHFLRRIKSVSISIPCVVGPYTSVSGTLTMESSKLRGSDKVQGSYADESNYSNSFVARQPIATSSSQNDSGLFELNFRDERYLPFEGGGAISDWKFTLPRDFRAFDYSTISDLVMHLRYTARVPRVGGEALARLATESFVGRLNSLVRSQGDDGLVNLISVRHDFVVQWQSAKQQPETLVQLELVDDLFPYMFRSRVRVQAAAFAWMVHDDEGRLAVSKLDGEVIAGANKLPTVIIPKEAKAADEPWLIVTYWVDAGQLA